jgi:hypothetical protein
MQIFDNLTRGTERFYFSAVRMLAMQGLISHGKFFLGSSKMERENSRYHP